jgi:membrane fusion protein, multidrug efflux system
MICLQSSRVRLRTRFMQKNINNGAQAHPTSVPMFSMITRRYVALLLLSMSMSAFAQAPAAPVQLAESGILAADGRIRVQISAQQQTTLSTELAASIASLPFKEGDSFKAGQTLMSFDCSLFHAQLDKAQALSQAARQTLQVNRRLAELNSISNLEVEQAQAKVLETEAEATVMRVTVSKCRLVAPFSGRIAKLHVDAHQYVTQGKPLLDIIDMQRPEVKMIVPSRWLVWLKKGTNFTVHVDDLNRDYAVRVTRLGARIDPVSQSISLAGEIEGAPTELLPGMSGWAAFKAPK